VTWLESSLRISTTFETSDEFTLVLVRDCCVCSEFATYSVLQAFLALGKEVVAEIGSGDELSKKIYASYQQFRALIMGLERHRRTRLPK
jgi:hypothetical protein